MNIKINIDAPELANAIHALANALSVKPGEVNFSQEVAATSEKPQKEEAAKKEPEKQTAKEAPKSESDKPAPKITIEQVRSKLTALSQSGKQVQVKELIQSFGVNKLTDIPEDKFDEVLAASEKL